MRLKMRPELFDLYIVSQSECGDRPCKLSPEHIERAKKKPAPWADAGFCHFPPSEHYAGRMATISNVSGSMIKS